MLGNTRVSARLLGEQLRGTAVALRALGAGEFRVDPVADERMHERQRPARLEDPDSPQQISRIRGLELFDASESRRLQ